MKVAICYYGTVGSNIGKFKPDSINHVQECYKSIKKYIINNNENFDFDIFIHSWSKNYENEIIKLFNPVDYKIESQISFLKNSLEHLDKYKNFKSFFEMIKYRIKFMISSSCKEKYYSHLISILPHIYSRWYSTLEVNLLKRKYEQANNFEYDLVMINRFDNYLYSYLDLKDIDPSKIYSSKWDCGRNIFFKKKYFDNKHTQDYWYISSSKKINILSELFKHLKDYSPCSHRASFQHINKYIGKRQMAYILEIKKDYELYRRVKQ